MYGASPPLSFDVYNYYQTDQHLSKPKRVLFAQRTAVAAARRAESGTKKAEENGLNSGYYAHTQRTRDIASTEAELSFCVAG